MTHSIPQFLLITRRGERGTVMVAFGRLVLGHGARWGAWTPFIEQATRGTVYVDLSGITQFDAAGIGLLVRVAPRIRRQGRDICIVAARPPECAGCSRSCVSRSPWRPIVAFAECPSTISR
jgi:hypothetical protein